jgi:hypothetical protein
MPSYLLLIEGMIFSEKVRGTHLLRKNHPWILQPRAWNGFNRHKPFTENTPRGLLVRCATSTLMAQQHGKQNARLLSS